MCGVADQFFPAKKIRNAVMEEPVLRTFRENLFVWAASNRRPMPWKGEKDPYKIWLSEIILQQTRVEQGLPYYEKFAARYPDVRDLAEAPEDEVMKLWQGLGYYTRARNLHAAAKQVAYKYGGKFPDTFDAIRTLPGVGDYTAAAIASFAFNLPHAVLDGNVYRVLARRFGIPTPVDTPAAKKEFSALAQALLDKERPGAFNQAMMDFGATHCTPQQPRCPACPIQNACVAFETKKTAELPVKSKKTGKKARFFLYLVFDFEGATWVKKRGPKDIWQDLYEFPLLELPALPADIREAEALIREFWSKNDLPELPSEIEHRSPPYRHILTHQIVTAEFLKIRLPDTAPDLFNTSAYLKQFTHVPFVDLKQKFAFSRLIDLYLTEKVLTLGF
jgi:A/G-specific adenine glycosylase